MNLQTLFLTLRDSLWVCLATDALLWLLAFAFLGGLVVILRSPLQRAVWQKVFQQRLAVVSAVLLAVAAVFALLDSIHFREPLPPLADASAGEVAQVRYAVEVRSVLDLLLTGLRSDYERTYSAPLAVNLSALEPVTVTLPDGTTVVRREAPRLRVAGQAFPPGPVSAEAYWSDVLMRVGSGTVGGLLLASLLMLIGWGLLRLQRTRAGTPLKARVSTPLRCAGASVTALCVIGGVFISLSGNFHVFGTDKVGQDVLYQVLKSIRTGLIIGLVTTLVMLPLAVLLGIVAGYFRGWIDDVIQYIYTVLNSIPGVLLIAAAVLMMQVVIDTHPEWFSTAAERADLRLLALCFILGITSWTGLCRLLRGETLKLRELEYIQAAQAFGVSSWRIVVRHILPNLMHIVIIALVMDFSGLVLAEAVLSYVGIGVDPTMTSFGTMINSARMELGREPVVWWSLAAAFTTMFILVLAANLFADAVRDAFDPRAA